MPITHIFLAFLVAFVWGINVIFIKLGLKEMSPLLLCALRFLVAGLPAIFFVPLPKGQFRTILIYGLVMFDLQFGLLFTGMYLGMPAGMTALVTQVQVFFSIFFAVILLKEQPHPSQILGAMVASLGIVLMGLHLDRDLTISGLIFVLGAAATWGTGNLIIKKCSYVDNTALLTWGCFFAAFPMTFLTWVIDGPDKIFYSLTHMTLIGILAVAYIAFLSTWVGYGVWNWLLVRHPIATVAPFTLLTPIAGMIGAVFILHEPLYMWKVISGILVLLGLYLNTFGTRLYYRYKRAVKM